MREGVPKVELGGAPNLRSENTEALASVDVYGRKVQLEEKLEGSNQEFFQCQALRQGAADTGLKAFHLAQALEKRVSMR